ncbi:hypothetical protein Pelo_6981 [Pelomyxa schiedti]|nr:hypothetical protein Pelo_6981 [Pelomyxa schiedti]
MGNEHARQATTTTSAAATTSAAVDVTNVDGGVPRSRDEEIQLARRRAKHNEKMEANFLERIGTNSAACDPHGLIRAAVKGNTHKKLQLLANKITEQQGHSAEQERNAAQLANALEGETAQREKLSRTIAELHEELQKKNEKISSLEEQIASSGNSGVRYYLLANARYSHADITTRVFLSPTSPTGATPSTTTSTTSSWAKGTSEVYKEIWWFRSHSCPARSTFYNSNTCGP